MEPSFYSNESEIKFLDKIIDSLDRCASFSFSVSFIKKAGLILFLSHLEQALERGAKGRIITSTYQNFTDIASLQIFLELQNKFPNFECRLEDASFGDDGFHTKGYLFEYPDSSFESIIGSSNITRFALLVNKEWDIGVREENDPLLQKEILKEFNYYWNTIKPLTREAIRKYEEELAYAITSWDMDYLISKKDNELNPNLMQRQALKEIQRYRNMGVDKAMVIAATGSGKTYLAAFDARNFDAKKLLFVVHKDAILTQAMKTFMSVFKDKRTYGLYNGEYHDSSKQFVFASNQMLARHLELFDKDEFDYIVIDEVHHAAAETYKKIIEHFNPSFLLGLTATPDRMDGEDVYSMFGNNVPFDLRLREALENNLIVPFKYYGIKDELVSYANDGTSDGNREIIRQISSSIHMEFVRDEIEKYHPTGKLRCIGFTKNVEHAKEMARGMRGLGYNTDYITGSSSLGERIKIFQRLEDESDPLEMVFAIDILNEGIDVPSINMVLFLRPTESSTIFIQQLGRGLRKFKDKEYLTVLDFIANSYTRSVQIALALGSLSKGGVNDKISLSTMVRTNFSSLNIPNLEINFEEKSKEEILASIERTNFNSIIFLKQDYANFKEYLKLSPNEYPKHSSYLENDVGVDLLHFTRKYSSYYDFLSTIGEDVPFFSKEEKEIIGSIFYFLPLVRPEIYLIIKELMNGKKTIREIYENIKEFPNVRYKSLEYCLRVLLDEFHYTKPSYHHTLIRKDGDYYSLTFSLDDNDSFKEWINSLLEYGLNRYQNEFFDSKSPLKLYYPYMGISSLLALGSENLFRMTGIFNVGDRRILFVDLKKELRQQEHLRYADSFLSSGILQWESQTGTKMNNNKGLDLINNPDVWIFVRKAKKEDGVDMPFYYIGKGKLTNPRPTENTKETLLFDIILEKKVPLTYFDNLGIELDGKENN